MAPGASRFGEKPAHGIFTRRELHRFGLERIGTKSTNCRGETEQTQRNSRD
jgi:hypothetical protein